MSGQNDAERSPGNARLFLQTLLFTALVPGTVIGWIPWFILGPAGRTLSDSPWLRALAVISGSLGGAMYVWCVWDFAARGRSIPARVEHPKFLVATGLYRYLRNPMYIGVLFVLIAEAVGFSECASNANGAPEVPRKRVVYNPEMIKTIR